MKLLNNIKESINKSKVAHAQKTHKRGHKICNLGQAKNVGIIFSATDEHNFGTVRNLMQTLEKRGQIVTVLGLTTEKEIPGNWLFRKGIDFILLKDLNWYGKPTSPAASDFIKTPFDILIDASSTSHIALNYIVSLSESSFKVGRQTTFASNYDLTIEVGNNLELNYFIEQLTHYLEIINTNHIN